MKGILSPSEEGSEKSNEGTRAYAQAGGPEDPNEAEVLAGEIASDLRKDGDASIRDIILGHARVRQLVVAAAVRSLSAEKFYFSKTEGKMVHEPDYATQMKAVAWLASYSDGLPVQTNLNLNANASKAKPQSMEVLLSSPAMLAAAKRLIAKAEAATGGVAKGGMKTALPATYENDETAGGVK